jgi:hypothetical protein
MRLERDLEEWAGSNCDSRRVRELAAEIRGLIGGLERRIATLEARVAELEGFRTRLCGDENADLKRKARPRQFDEFEAAVERRFGEEARPSLARTVRQGERATGRP